MKKLFCALLPALLVFSLCACGGVKAERFSSEIFDYFDTVTTVTAYDVSAADFDKKLSLFTEKIGEYHGLFDIYSPYEKSANIYTLNMEAGNAPVKVDGRIIDLLEYGKKVYELTRGKVNICFGSVLSLWHDCREAGLKDPKNSKLPDMNMLKQAAKHTDINDLIIDREKSTVYFADSEMSLDVGAIAKGYAAGELTEWAKENLWSSAVISIGGNVCAFGGKADSTPWNIGVESPDKDLGDYAEVLKITDGCVVTSGDYQRFYTVNGKDYCHIIDPDTLMPAEYFSGVTVLCDDSALADALSTALFNMSIEQGTETVESMDGVEALWIDKENNRHYSSGFKEYIKK